MNNKPITALIVDDEIQACENLESFIRELNSQIHIIGYAHNTSDAETLIQSKQPDVVFLDIHMPKETGIDFLKRIQDVSFETVFVTAYDEFAIKAFKLNAIDYVLKPIKRDYLKKTLIRISDLLSIKNKESTTSTEIINKIDADNANNHLLLRDGANLHYIKFEDVLYLAAQGSYTAFHTKKINKPLVASYNLKHYEEILPENFSRVHRGYIINIDTIKRIEQKVNKYSVTLKNEVIVPISRRKYKLFKEILN